MYKNAGFTLIELLVVVLIIGILAAAALPQYKTAVRRAQAMEGLAAMRNLEKAERAYFAANGQYTMDLDALDITLPEFVKRVGNANYFSFRTKDILWEMSFTDRHSTYTLTGYLASCIALSDSTKPICQSFGEYQKFVFTGTENRSYYTISKNNWW